jgi:hypothetical protein
MLKYIAKVGGWFKPGTECILEADCESMGGIFIGIRISEGPPELHPIGEEYEDGESCPWHEFDILETT